MSSPLDFFSVTPCRVVDTRTGGSPLVAGIERTLAVAGVCGIPFTAAAVSINVAVTQPTAAGNVRLYPSGSPVPNSSTINYGAGQTRTNNTVVGLGNGGELAARNQPSGTTHVIIDVNGYFEEPPPVPVCGNDVVEGGELCDDGNSLPGDGCSDVCAVESGWTCLGSPSVCATTCGDGIPAGGEQCDDGNVGSGDGCSAACLAESGFTCAGSPSVCAATCGDGIPAGGEQCDDGNVVSGDGCSPVCSVESGYTCAGSPSVCTPAACGNGAPEVGEECDDGNTANGDGCSSTCLVEIVCIGGQARVVVRATDVPKPIPDNSQTGTLSTINVGTAGVVRQAIAVIGNISHTFDADLDIFLSSPFGPQRELSSDNGGSGVNYTATTFDDGAPTSITAGTAPFQGRFRPEQAISSAAPAGFVNQASAGAWSLRVSDDTAASVGSLNSWTIALCVDTAAPIVCGNGIVETGETCDDMNASNGDGCSTVCQVELACPGAQSAIVTKSTDFPKLIPDNSPAGVTSTITVPTSAPVRKVMVVIGALSHQFDGDVDSFVVSPAGTQRELSTDNGGNGDDYVATIFDDVAPTAITGGASPFRGSFRPEQAISGTAPLGFGGEDAAGTWTLRVIDDAGADGGLLGSWVLALCVGP